MEESNNKELIEVIKERLKVADDRPYRAGAWEGFKAKYEPKKTTKLLPAYWAAAAALVVAGFTFLLRTEDQPRDFVVVQQENAGTQNQELKPQIDSKSGWKEEQQRPTETPRPASGALSDAVFPDDAVPSSRLAWYDHSTIVAMNERGLSGPTQPWQTGQSMLNFKLNLSPKIASFGDDVDHPEIRETNLGEGFELAQRPDAHELARDKAALKLNPTRFNFNDKFEVGAFLSPSTTNQRFDVGGGLVLAYQLSDKLALRTGAAFNQYEVGLLGSELSASSSEGMRFNSPETPVDGAALVSKDVPYRASNLLLPDLNFVSGKVQTLDIPLEIKYNVGRQFYATGGISYAVVLSQERFNHITEYSGAPTYSSASDSGQPTNQPTAVERTLQAETNNVNTNGFGGFANFSIGRKTTLSKSFKLSIEPFVKIPIGQFKRADMNYTNGGLRVITTF
ncbi:outer membrane beta-barrel protein [Sphingobacterium paludis]|uniref:Outer membrane protein with beta-barrel domain n=1 Tax=Sphingobacterium paludis TaxID=1476465 RepID=A0A4R7D8T9_9SPHI|nr:outer membrane beta-barrel protein [Sphingobacterium paludis]TDS17693.1 outer membrane protein with beta-barrel domain [Sphingobacterium paludis]